MRERLRSILVELEDMDYHVQQGCVDSMVLCYLKDADSADPNDLMSAFHDQVSVAHEAVEKLLDMTKEEE